MNQPLHRAQQAYEQRFNQSPERLFQAPGRVNLIGEHTDYNNGFVLPTAIDRGTYMALGYRDDNVIQVMALDIEQQESRWKSEAPIPHDTKHSWANYLRGVHQEFIAAGHTTTQGMNIVVAGNIPQGAGLSSSASFSVVFSTALNAINELQLSPEELALLCQAAENNFVGCQCGIMDQLISAAGNQDHALLIDCKDLSLHPVPIPTSMAVMIIDSKVTRGLVDSEYNDRREQCERAARNLDVTSLREASMADLMANKNKLDAIAFKRAHHVISENTRTLGAADALKHNDIGRLSTLMAESHASMRDDFEITVPAIDFLVELISAKIGNKGGVRMTGGGFGGCVVCVLPPELVSAVKDTIDAFYGPETGLIAEIHLCKASAGAGEIR